MIFHEKIAVLKNMLAHYKWVFRTFNGIFKSKKVVLRRPLNFWDFKIFIQNHDFAIFSIFFALFLRGRPQDEML